MKRLLQFALLLVIILADAQQKNYPYVATGFDLRNAVSGSKPTNGRPELDYQLKASTIYRNVEIGIQFENFPAIDYKQYSVYANYVVPVYRKFSVSAGLEAGSIIREGNSNYLFYGCNTELRYDLHPFVVGVQLNYKYRYCLTYLYDLPDREFRAWVAILTFIINSGNNKTR